MSGKAAPSVVAEGNDPAAPPDEASLIIWDCDDLSLEAGPG